MNGLTKHSAILLLMGVVACSPKVIQKPIPFSEERVKLSLNYMKERHGIDATSPSIIPRVVVVHWTAIDSFDKSWGAFEKTTLPSSRTGISGASSLNVSSHYLIDQDGSIYQLLPDTLFARHTIGLNYTAIGIENVGGRNLPLTEKQFKSNKKLIKELMKMYPIEYVIGHHEYQQFRSHPLWKETDPDYLTEKSDPGDEFMKKLRKKLGVSFK